VSDADGKQSARDDRSAWCQSHRNRGDPISRSALGRAIPNLRAAPADVWEVNGIGSMPVSDVGARRWRSGVPCYFVLVGSARKRRMRVKTLAYIAGVTTPVDVFCWLGWYTPNRRMLVPGMFTSAP